ncbi:hypothetical protein BC937DRAFT_91400 [Endogone sp. FLAS-F59071]|nr:hypothetical protein BC937DRAFT_91400 [Endogone sp. FLAS-F59071]|eukprot:RUS21808.1 hypothetical protein BC937DRAFT_91400 [Endogone sp. FLAS-F59071]
MQFSNTSSLARDRTRKAVLWMFQNALITTATLNTTANRVTWKLTCCRACHRVLNTPKRALLTKQEWASSFSSSIPRRGYTVAVLTLKHFRQQLHEQRRQFLSKSKSAIARHSPAMAEQAESTLSKGQVGLVAVRPLSLPVSAETSPLIEQPASSNLEATQAIRNDSLTWSTYLSSVENGEEWLQTQYRTLLAHLTRQHSWIEVLQVIRDMRKSSIRNIRIESFEYETLVLALAAAETEGDNVARLYGVIIANYLNTEKKRASMGNTCNAMRPTATTFKVILTYHLRRREIYTARRVFHDMTEIGQWEIDAETLGIMAWGLLKAGDLEASRGFWRRAVALGAEKICEGYRGAEPILTSKDIRSVFVKACVNRDLLEEAVKAIREFRTIDNTYLLSNVELRKLVRGFIERGSTWTAVRIFEEFREIGSATVDMLQEAAILGPIIRKEDVLAWRAHAMIITRWKGTQRQINGEQIRQLFTRLLSSITRGEILLSRSVHDKLVKTNNGEYLKELLAGILLGVYSRNGNARGIKRIFTKMNGPPSIRLSGRLLDELVQQARLDAIEIFYNSMRSLQPSVWPSRRVYEAVIIGLATHGLYQEAAQWHERFVRDGAQPSVNALHKLIRISVDARDLQVAMAVYDSTIPLFFARKPVLTNAPPSSSIHTKTHARSLKPIIYIYAMLIHSLTRQSSLMHSHPSAYKASIDSSKYSNNLSSQKFDTMATIHRLCANMYDLEILPNAVFYNTLLNAVLQSSNIDVLGKLYADMIATNARPTAYTYAILMNAVIKCGHGTPPKDGRELESVMALLQDMRVQGVEPDIVVWSTVLNALSKTGNVNDAEKLVMESTKIMGPNLNVTKKTNGKPRLKAGINTWMVNELMNTMASNGDINGVRGVWQKYFGQMRSTSYNSDERTTILQPDVVSYSTMIKANLKNSPSKGRAHAELILEQMVHEGLRPTNKTLVHLVGAHLECRDVRAVQELVERFEREWEIGLDELGWRRILYKMAKERDTEGLEWAVKKLLVLYNTVENPLQAMIERPEEELRIKARPVKYEKKQCNQSKKTYTQRMTVQQSIGRGETPTPPSFVGHTAQTIIKKKPPMTFLNRVFVPRLLSRMFEVMFAGTIQITGHQQSSHVKHIMEARALQMLHDLQIAGVYIAKQVINNTLIPKLVERGWTAKEAWRKIIK